MARISYLKRVMAGHFMLTLIVCLTRYELVRIIISIITDNLKGLTFEKPERVPFRLTQNMIDAFGVYGYEG